MNASPHPLGNLRLDRRVMRYDVLTGEALQAARAAGEELYLSHFADCPVRKAFKKASGK